MTHCDRVHINHEKTPNRWAAGAEFSMRRNTAILPQMGGAGNVAQEHGGAYVENR